MTPVARELTKQLLLPRRKRAPPWNQPDATDNDLTELLRDIHCFECTEVLDAAVELGRALRSTSETYADEYIGNLSFLPAPRTWIEWQMKITDPTGVEIDRVPVAVHLWDMDLPKDKAKLASAMIVFADSGAGPLGFISLTSGDTNFPGGVYPISPKLKRLLELKGINGTEFALSVLGTAQILLVLINTPRVIGRRQNPAHKGLQRDLNTAFGRGKFPLNGWTEILLDVAKPIEIDDGEPHEARLTGRRALHFCRAHLRVRLGKLEYVTSHWRGDPSIGIKQSRYTVVG